MLYLISNLDLVTTCSMSNSFSEFGHNNNNNNNFLIIIIIISCLVRACSWPAVTFEKEVQKHRCVVAFAKVALSLVCHFLLKSFFQFV